MTEDKRRERDLILAPNEYAFILDETKGNVVNYVGPHKTSLANTDQPVNFNVKTKRFERCILEQAIKPYAISPEGWYVVLKNPAKDCRPPTSGVANSLPELNIGRKVNIPGPVAFAPWPGQMVQVIQGHHLRSNHYLIVRVYDEEAARANWGKAVIKPQAVPKPETGQEKSPDAAAVKPDEEIPDLTLGKLLVIKGTDVSFYIPPTGIEVVRSSADEYVRDAVTLERLEYCILLDEDGNKRYIRGPAVVFPRPTEVFIEKNGFRKFKAMELNEISGIYVKVIAAYQEDGKTYKVGDELFITGKEQMIYFPRPEHAIVRYGDQDVNHAVAIPAGEARYVLNRMTGQILLKRGPCMFLPDPRKEVIARRIIQPRLVQLWFPGNQEAYEYNQRLMELARQEQAAGFVADLEVQKLMQLKAAAPREKSALSDDFAGDEFTRKQQFSRPRTVTLDTKYEGAVAINVWTGYAVLVVSKTGDRKVIVGPQTYLLEYDETLEVFEFSTGVPKTDEKLFKTVYLRVLHNKVSDMVKAETRDLCNVRILVSYRVNFEGDPHQWFNVENYVKFLTDHLRSMLRHAIRRYGIEEFYTNAISIVRDTVLGLASETSKRPGALFEENNMRVYDVEVLDVAIGDDTIASLLIDAQHTTVEQTLEVAADKKKLEITCEKETIKQQIAGAEAETTRRLLDIQTEDVNNRLNLEMKKISAEAAAHQARLKAKMADQEPLETINNAELSRLKAKYDLDLTIADAKLKQRLAELYAEVQAVVNKAQAVSPQLVAALRDFSDKALAEKMAQSMAPLAILGGNSIAEVFANLLKGTVLEEVLTQPRLAPPEPPTTS